MINYAAIVKFPTRHRPIFNYIFYAEFMSHYRSFWNARYQTIFIISFV